MKTAGLMVVVSERSGSRPQRWVWQIPRGLCRCGVLVGLTGVLPVVGTAVGFFGVRFALSWSEHLRAAVAVRGLAVAGEVALAAGWTLLAIGLTVLVAGRPLCQAVRRCAEHWQGVRVEVRYRAVPPVTKMATGYWWNGY